MRNNTAHKASALAHAIYQARRAELAKILKQHGSLDKLGPLITPDSRLRVKP